MMASASAFALPKPASQPGIQVASNGTNGQTHRGQATAGGVVQGTTASCLCPPLAGGA